MNSLIDTFVNNVEKEELNVLYAQIRKDNEIKGDWSRFSTKRRVEAYSATKSFTAVGIGIAIDEGILTLDEKVSDSFPEYTYNIIDPNILDITVQDLLTMSSGLRDKLFAGGHKLRKTTRDWTQYFFEKGEFIRKPGEEFLYSNFNTYLLSHLLEKKTGKNLLEYTRYRLFEPLGIGNPDMKPCPMGHTIGAFGLSIDVDELGYFGEMLLNRGEYEGKRIVSGEFIDKMITPRFSTDKILHRNEPQTFDYGYQIWIDSQNKCFNLWGVFGQYCIVLPEKNAVVTVVSLEEDDLSVRNRIWKDIILQI